MPTINPQKILLGKIEGLKIANEAFSKPSFFNSFPSIGTANSLTFLTDFFKVLFGLEKLKSEFIRFLLTELKGLGEELLEAFKKKIVEYYYCNIDRVIPNEFFTEQKFKVTEIDFFGILKIDPDSSFGKHYYQDYPNNLDKILANAIKKPNTVFNWESILNIRYEADYFYVALDGELQGKTINDFVNLYFSNIQLFDKITVVSDFIDGIFGTLTTLGKLSKPDVENRIKFDNILTKMIENFEVDDSFFVFDNEEIFIEAKKKSAGKYVFKDCEINQTEYDYTLLSGFIDELITSTNVEQTYDVNFNYLVNQTAINVTPSDKASYSGNIFIEFFRYITKSITFALFSPKKILFIKLFSRMANKANVDLNVVDFLKTHKNLFIDIIRKRIYQAILKYLMSIIIRELTKILTESNIKRREEQLKNYKIQVQSLIGF